MTDPVNVLLVDDEPRNLDALEALLDGRGYRILRAGSADLALRLLLETSDIAVIILDIRMPQVNGIELAQLIKGSKRFREIPILFLTAHLVDDRDVISGYGAGAVDYLTKPVNPDIMRHKVAVFADLFRKTRALAELNDKLEERVRERTLELELSEAALRAAARQKDEFLAVLAHELRNPLAPLRTGLDLLAQLHTDALPVVGRTLATMDRQLAHIVRLIDDLLDVSRINTGVLELKKERVDLASIVNSATDSFRGVFEQRKIALGVEASAGIEAVVDPTRIRQIIGNLLHNASKFTGEGGHVVVTLGHHEGEASIRVTDDGMGIPAEELQRVFEMFTKVKRESSTASQGAGIGLALSKRLAEMHGGALEVTSPGEGRGSTFVVTLGARLAAAALTAPDLGPLPVRRRSGRAIRVLLIEDNEDAGDMLVLWLERLGHEVRLARDGTTGLDMLLRDIPDLVLCDLGLPDIDGIEVCTRARTALAGSRPVMVALTGWGQAEDRQKTRNAGFDRHLVKPVSLDALAEVITSVG